MTIRRLILLLVAPLFLLLAAVNGALLYGWELREAERGLEKEAVAAAVTVAAFADDPEALVAALAQPARAAAFRVAAGQVADLRGLYVVGADGRAHRIAGAAPGQDLVFFERPTRPAARLVQVGDPARPVMAATAPTGRSGFVVAEIDAAPLVALEGDLRRDILALVAAAGLLGVLLANLVANRIVRELARSGATLEAIRSGVAVEDVRDFRIRETRDLAAAVRLMQTSVAARLARGRRELARRDGLRTETVAACAYRDDAFPALAASEAGCDLAVRRMGDATPGAFHALCRKDGRAALVIGECTGESPGIALANALAASRSLSAGLLDGDPAARLADARAAFGIERLDWITWSADAPLSEPRALVLLDGAQDHVRRYVTNTAALAPEETLSEIATVLAPRGVMAIVRPAQPGRSPRLSPA
jgi:hypothetical protein